jgi:hypothetical protein
MPGSKHMNQITGCLSEVESDADAGIHECQRAESGQQRPSDIDANLNLSKDASETLVFLLGREIHHFVQLLVSSWIQRGRIGIEIRSFNCHGLISDNRLEGLLARGAAAPSAPSFTADR